MFIFQMILRETTLLFISGNLLSLKLILTFHLKVRYKSSIKIICTIKTDHTQFIGQLYPISIIAYKVRSLQSSLSARAMENLAVSHILILKWTEMLKTEKKKQTHFAFVVVKIRLKISFHA